MKMTKKRVVTLIAVIGIVILGIKGRGLLQKRRAQVADAPIAEAAKLTMPVVRAKEGTIARKERFLGRLLAQKSIKLSTKLAGYVRKVYVQESQFVHKGEPLVEIDAAEIRSSIAALESALRAQRNDLAVARSIYRRNEKLYEAGGLAKEKLDLSRAAMRAKISVVENTRQKIAQLTHQLSYLKILAPFDGVVDTLILHEGDLAAAGKPILAMSSREKKLLFSYAPALQDTIVAGKEVFWNGRYVGKIKTLYNTSQNGLSDAEVALEREIDRPIGTSLDIEVKIDEAKGCVVPSDTLLHKKEGVFVMVYDAKSFEPRRVSVKLQVGNSAIISPCPDKAIAKGTEVKLASLPAFGHVETTEAE